MSKQQNLCMLTTFKFILIVAFFFKDPPTDRVIRNEEHLSRLTDFVSFLEN